MPLLATNEGGGSEFAICPQGLHLGRCYSIIDLGTQQKEWKGEVKHLREVHIAFELYSCPPIETETGPMPQSISRFYTLSLGDKANLTFHLESWRGRPFTEDEKAGFDIEKLLGVAAQLQVLHKPKANGGVRAELANILPIAPGTKVADQENPRRFFSFTDKPSQEAFDALPNGIKKIMAKSPEAQPYLQPAAPTMVQAVASKISAAADAAAADVPSLVNDDNVPF